MVKKTKKFLINQKDIVADFNTLRKAPGLVGYATKTITYGIIIAIAFFVFVKINHYLKLDRVVEDQQVLIEELRSAINTIQKAQTKQQETYERTLAVLDAQIKRNEELTAKTEEINADFKNSLASGKSVEDIGHATTTKAIKAVGDFLVFKQPEKINAIYKPVVKKDTPTKKVSHSKTNKKVKKKMLVTPPTTILVEAVVIDPFTGISYYKSDDKSATRIFLDDREKTFWKTLASLQA